MDLPFWLAVLKLAHLGGLILWLGPSGGAWLLLQRAKRRVDPESADFRALYRDFLPFFWVEHFGLLLLLGSGVGMLMMYGSAALQWDWIRIKLLLIILVLVPIEILDIWFGHVRLPRWFAAGGTAQAKEQVADSYADYERRFVPVSLPILLLTVIIIMWLAVAKPV